MRMERRHATIFLNPLLPQRFDPLKMEDPMAQDGDRLEYLLFPDVFSFPPCCVPFSARHLSPIPFSVCLSPIPVAVIPKMGRNSWASPIQRNWLKSFLPMLPQAKETTSLEMFYIQVYEAFLKKWDPEPIVSPLEESLSPEQLTERAKKRLKKVRVILDPLLPSNTHNPQAHR